MRFSSALGLVLLCGLFNMPSATPRHDAHDSIVSLRHRADMIKQAQLRIASRNAFLAASFPHERSGFASATLHSTAAVALLAPYYSCPYELTRSNLVSEDFEGGKWVCGVLQITDRPCVVYSFGSYGNDIFERHIQDLNPRCEIHVFDPTSAPLARYHYHSLGICGQGDSFQDQAKSYPCKQLPDIMRELNHTAVDVLKMDVEGSEWDVITATNWSSLSIGQILVEVHDQRATRTMQTLLTSYLGKLEAAGFFMFSLEPVCSGCGGQFELGFLNTSWSPFSATP
jgi:hypothetical protein